MAGEPPGVWAGRGLEDLGLVAGAEVDPDDMRLLFSDWADPRKVAEAMKAAEAEASAQGLTGARAAKFLKEARATAVEEARLGTAPYQFTPVEERLEAALAKEPYADERRRAEIERKVRKTQRQSVKFYDLTFSAPKSFSILHAAFQVEAQQAEARGDTKAAELARWKAEQVWEAVMDGNQAMLDYMQDKAGWARAGHHSKGIEGRTSGRYVRADRWIVASFRQHTSRDDDPQLHVHNPVLPKVRTFEPDPVTGQVREVWRAIDGQSIYRHRGAASAIGDRVAGESLMRRIEGVRMEMRPDGKAREIVGISEELRNKYSSRRRTVTEGVAELVAAYEERHGRTPGAHQVAKMAQFVTLESRRAKKKDAPTREQLLKRWEAAAIGDVKQSLAGVGKRVVSAGKGVPQAEVFDPDQVIAAAVEAVQVRKSSWHRSDLRIEMDRALPDCLGGLTDAQYQHLREELIETAVRPGKAQPVDVVSLMPPAAVPMPAELRREDGSSVYDTPEFELFATTEHLAREGRIVEATQAAGAPVAPAELVEEVIASAGLNAAQARAVRGITRSGRQADVLIGPAGAGKSRSVAALCEIWEGTGRGVMGVATSQRAADVLAEEGVDRVANLKMFIQMNERITAGEFVSLSDRQAYGVRPEDLVIVDEGNMADTADIEEARRITEARGGKFLISGDHHQVTAVGAGGMLHQLTTDAQPYVLDEVVRFAEEWEKDASLRVRKGDTGVLAEYRRHGRIRGGSGEEMTELAYQRWLADHLAGEQSLLIASTNRVAGDLAMRARAELVRLGRVEADGVELGCNTDVVQVAGVGDQIALRKNRRRLRAAGGKKKHWATNRDVVTVAGRNDDGSLRVRYDDGATMTLPAKYVRQHVELAYAGTVHSAEGRTVDTGHTLADVAMTREQFYVAQTRGRKRNHVYVPCEPTGQKTPAGEYVVPTAVEVLEQVMERTEVEQTATMTMRAEFERAQHLAVTGRVWEDLNIAEARGRYAQALADTLGEAEYERLLAGTDSYESVIRLARHVDEQGYDGAAMLAETAGGRSFVGTNDPGAALHARLTTALKRADQARDQAAKQAGEEPARPGWRTYVERTPRIDTERGRAMMAAAEVMDARVAELARRALEEQPAWTVQLGPVPEDPMLREDWVERAGIIARYREAHGYEAEADAIGAAPPQGAVAAHTAWEEAWQALGAPDERRDVAKLGDADLRKVIARHERELSWAPPNVDADLEKVSLARDDARARAALRRAELETVTDPDHRQALREELGMLEAAERLTGTQAAQMETIAEVYDRWHTHTRPVREQATMAREELDRRHPKPATENETGAGRQEQPRHAAQQATVSAEAENPPLAPRIDLRPALEAAERAAQILHERERQAEQDAAAEEAVRAEEYAQRRRTAQQQAPARKIQGPRR